MLQDLEAAVLHSLSEDSISLLGTRTGVQETLYETCACVIHTIIIPLYETLSYAIDLLSGDCLGYLKCEWTMQTNYQATFQPLLVLLQANATLAS